MAKKKKLIPVDQRLNMIEEELRTIESKYNCKLGCWLSWRDLQHNLNLMAKTPDFDIAEFKIDVKLN